MNKRRGISVGSISLILIFAVLCLTIFSLLTLSSAKGDARLSKRFAAAVSDYYAADTAAEGILLKLTDALESARRPLTLEGRKISYGEEDGLLYAGWTSPVDENRSIDVLVSFDGESVSVERWRQTDNEGWVPSDKLDVWNGQ